MCVHSNLEKMKIQFHCYYFGSHFTIIVWLFMSGLVTMVSSVLFVCVCMHGYIKALYVDECSCTAVPCHYYEILVL